jgi:hypothetical protein
LHSVSSEPRVWAAIYWMLAQWERLRREGC